MDAIIEWLKPYGGFGFAGVVVVFVFWLVLSGKLVTQTMLTEIRSNDTSTIETLKEANRTALETLPKIAQSMETQEYVLKEIQQAGKQTSEGKP